uniref:Reverse transcriptase Ty1/copia-type domain-containing protein n=1 Tax=Amphimedon queenslandica TaxID=400682 RepID=A0A1X7VBJ8_AMPQE
MSGTAVWMKQLSVDMNLDISERTIIFEDNQAAICMSRNPQFHGCTEHIVVTLFCAQKVFTFGT